jgi:hypothetical protein
MKWSLKFILEWSHFWSQFWSVFFFILFKNAFCFIYKNSDYNLLPVEGILLDGLTTSMAEVNKQKF